MLFHNFILSRVSIVENRMHFTDLDSMQKIRDYDDIDKFGGELQYILALIVTVHRLEC